MRQYTHASRSAAVPAAPVLQARAGAHALFAPERHDGVAPAEPAAQGRGTSLIDVPSHSKPVEPARGSGLPPGLRAGVESLSGLAMDDVRVHRDSPEPARLGALAYARGSDIHLGPGQEQHLPHEAWHVVQQKQGRVAATAQMKGMGLNDDVALEAEADRMGDLAGRAHSSTQPPQGIAQPAFSQGASVAQPKADPAHGPKDGIKDKKAENLADEVAWTKEYKSSIPLPNPAFDLTFSLNAEASFEHEALTAAAEALTKAEMKQDETTVGMHLNLKGKEILQVVKSAWKKGISGSLLSHDKLSASLSTEVGDYELETTTPAPPPLSIATKVKPRKDVIIPLGKGFQAKVKAEYELKAVERSKPETSPKFELEPVSPWTSLVGVLMMLLAIIADYWWVPVLIL